MSIKKFEFTFLYTIAARYRTWIAREKNEKAGYGDELIGINHRGSTSSMDWKEPNR